MARSTVENTVERIRRQLASSLRLEVNTLGANLNASTTTVTLTYDLSTSLFAGSILSVGTELMRVISVNANSKEVTVIRGWQDSDAGSHTTGDEVLINPRFTRFDIYDAIVDEITSWWPRLFSVASYQWTVTDEDEVVELPASMADAIGVVEVRRQWTDAYSATSTNDSWPTINFRLMRGTVGTWDAVSASGLLIRLIPNHAVQRDGTIHALIAQPFDVTTTTLAESDDLVADVGLLPSMLDLLTLGVKLRLMGDDENGRSARIVQDEPRRVEEIPPGSSLSVAQTMRANYERRLGDEVRKLQTKYPMRSW